MTKKNDIDDEIIKNSRFSSLFWSGSKPPYIEEIANFEKELLSLPKKLEFRMCKNVFQREMKEDPAKIKEKNSSKIIILADKTRNYYKCDLQQYEKLVTENISKEYRKANENELNQVNMEAVKIAKNEKLENKMEIFTPDEAYLKIKDHKPEFHNALIT